MNQQETLQDEKLQPKQGPGDVLQTARISVGLTLEEVARKMHLSTDILNSLEDNNFDDITAPIFVKGYLRAYSRLVSIDEDEIIQQYTTYYADGDPPILTTSNTAHEINSDDSRVKWITYLMIIGLIALLSTWWWNRYQQSPEMVSLESESQLTSGILSDEPTVEGSLLTMKSTVVDKDSDKEPLQQEVKLVDGSVTETTESPTESPTETATPLETDNVAISAPSVETDVTKIKTATQVQLADVVTDAIETKKEVISDNGNNLLITVNADAWVSIKDADGKKLVYGLLHTGETMSVSGKAPFNAFLGNGHGVSLKYKGKLINLSSVIQPDNTARVKIGQ